MGEIRNFRDLDAWKVGMDLVELTYRFTTNLPDTERYGLISQMRRAAVSVPSNVAEGQGVRAPRWTLRFVQTAIGSVAELETQMEVAVRLRFVGCEVVGDLQSVITRERQLLYGIRREKLRS